MARHPMCYRTILWWEMVMAHGCDMCKKKRRTVGFECAHDVPTYMYRWQSQSYDVFYYIYFSSFLFASWVVRQAQAFIIIIVVMYDCCCCCASCRCAGTISFRFLQFNFIFHFFFLCSPSLSLKQYCAVPTMWDVVQIFRHVIIWDISFSYVRCVLWMNTRRTAFIFLH